MIDMSLHQFMIHYAGIGNSYFEGMEKHQATLVGKNHFNDRTLLHSWIKRKVTL